MCSAEFFDVRDATTEPLHAQYQYIAVGGGTARCALATTLSEQYKVLLLERGGTPYGNPRIERVEGWSDLLVDDPRNPSETRFYSRASAAQVRAAGWKPSRVAEAYRWVEKKIVHPGSHGVWQTALQDSLLQTGVTPNNGLNNDHIYGTKVGGSLFDKQGRRDSAADFLSYANDKLLTVLTFANVQRIIFDNSGKIYHVEIIYSKTQPGALGSPQLLLLSGIGSCEHLAEFNITCHVELNAVGADMVDNPKNAIVVLSPTPVETSLLSVVGIDKEFIIEGGSGSNFSWQLPGMGQLNYVAPSQRTPDFVASAFILTKLYDPISYGSLRLNSTDINRNPYVKFNYYSHPRDIEYCISGVKRFYKLLRAPAFQPFRFTTVTSLVASIYYQLKEGESTEGAYLPDVSNYTETAEWCRTTLTTIWHFHGGCTVGKVVDKSYRVFGTRPLRVVDGSTFTKSPGTNPQATVMMLGRYVGVKILKERRITPKAANTTN
uniref:Glucose-methanol-choline oxidoreductase N-terminal domain-containing protein n=1 Tax=Physcomitrium patens TaxID=3218 RepID=A0A2K1KMD7_PHYPA|nr:hypothetical protein PHYPA_005820 [Physcomitrium patens]